MNPWGPIKNTFKNKVKINIYPFFGETFEAPPNGIGLECLPNRGPWGPGGPWGGAPGDGAPGVGPLGPWGALGPQGGSLGRAPGDWAPGDIF